MTRDPSMIHDDPSTPSRYDETVDTRTFVFELERRQFVKLLGGGLLVVAAAPRVLGQESGRQRGQGNPEPKELAAWLHIDEKGHVTAATGKVEIGQNIRTSLSQTVADELHVPLSSVTLLMGDTSQCPFDMGTFGSRTTPFMAPLMAKAAAAAREMLIDRAAASLGVERSALAAKDGRVVAANGKSIGYGEITKGQELTGVIPAEPAIEPRSRWRVRGTAVKKIDGRDFVTGQHLYTPDLTRPGLLYGRIVRPDSIGATLVSADDSRARGMAAVTVVRDGDFIGVVAPTERAAVRAANAVQATWKPLEGQPSSDTIYDHLKKTAATSGAQATAVGSSAVPAGARVFEASYRIPYIAHVPLEPRSAVAEWADGALTVWTGTQRPWGVRGELADAFHLPEDKVRVIVPDTGSGYGGKHSGECAIEAARLAKAAGKPVKLVWTRAEEFMWAYFRPAGVIDIRSAVDANGRIVLWEFDNTNSGPAGLETPYDIPVKKTVHHPSKTPLRQGSYRALAATANNYAREMHMDEMARALKVDPLEFRLQHLKKDERLRNVLKAAAEKAGWPRPSQPGRAAGLACGNEKLGYVATIAELSQAAGGYKVERLVTAFECGAVVNPDGVRNQVEGSMVQALGGATFEAIDFADGRIRNGSLEQYRVPRFKDVPPLETIILDRQDLQSVGAGECTMIGVAPAIGSAARAFGPVEPALPVRLTTAKS